MTNFRNHKKNLFQLLKNKICKICFASHVFACSEMNIGETWSISLLPSTLDKQHKNNPSECWKKSLKHLDKLLKHLDKALELLGKTLETLLAIR